MRILESLKKCYRSVMHPHDIANFTQAEQATFLHSLGEPEDDIKRCYIKYQCRRYLLKNAYIMIILNIFSCIIIPFAWAFYCMRGLLNRKSKTIGTSGLLLVRKDNEYTSTDDVFPASLIEEYHNRMQVIMKKYKEGYLDRISNRLFLICVCRYFFQPYMNLMVLAALADTSRLIHTFSPTAVVTFAEERSFVNPIVYALYKKWGVEYYGFMHGETFYQVDKGCFRYDRYYVWDKYYEELYEKLECDCEFIEYIPNKLMLDIKRKPIKECEYFCTYYTVGINDIDALMKISEVFSTFEKAGLRCKIRPHPRYTKDEVITRLFHGYCIEDDKKVSIKESIGTTYYVISTCSTVLSEAYYSGKEIVIDDCSNPKQYQQLAEKDYIMLSKTSNRLSTLCEQYRTTHENKNVLRGAY